MARDKEPKFGQERELPGKSELTSSSDEYIFRNILSLSRQIYGISKTVVSDAEVEEKNSLPVADQLLETSEPLKEIEELKSNKLVVIDFVKPTGQDAVNLINRRLKKETSRSGLSIFLIL